MVQTQQAVCAWSVNWRRKQGKESALFQAEAEKVLAGFEPLIWNWGLLEQFAFEVCNKNKKRAFTG